MFRNSNIVAKIRKKSETCKKKSDYFRFLGKIGNFVADLHYHDIYGTEFGIEGADPGGL